MGRLDYKPAGHRAKRQRILNVVDAAFCEK
jgi:hypothetical protein